MYTILHQKPRDFYYVKISGKVNHIQIIDFIRRIWEDHEDAKFLNVMTDYREAQIAEETTEPIKKIADFFNENLKKNFSHISWSNISKDSLPTTGSIILQGLVKSNNVNYKPFSTIEAALNWMELTRDDFDALEPLFESK